MIKENKILGGFVRLFFAFLIMLSCNSFAGDFSVNVYSSKIVTVGTSKALFFPANQSRSYLLIQNNGSANVTVYFANVNNAGIIIPPGGNYEPIKAEMDSIYMSAASASQSVLVLEGQ